MANPTRRAATFLALLAGCLMTAASAAGEERPGRVVSTNVCTDQLAMLVADEDQIVSVSHLAGDPGISVLAEQAERYAVNHGQAEEVFLMRPDLVLAGTYTSIAAVDMLRRLGFRVEQFAPESSFEGIRASLLRMGELLGREERAQALAAELDAGLAELAARPVPPLRVAIYSANSYTSGDGSLSDAVIEAAGLTNIADELGIVGTARLPLEQLVMARPDLVIVGEQDYPRPALAQQNFRHPAFEAVAAGARLVRIPDRYWICGAPFTLEAVQLLRDAARETAPRVAEHADD